jgi:hypothetical protein
MSIQDFLRRPSKVADAAPAGQADVKRVAEAIVSRLRSAFQDDNAFDRAIDEVAAQKSATKAVLTQIFYDLFERTRGRAKRLGFAGKPWSRSRSASSQTSRLKKDFRPWLDPPVS